LHDDLWLNSPIFQREVKQVGYNTNGLFATVTHDHRPILCAACHHSEALPGSGLTGVTPLTESIHSMHAWKRDPRSGLVLEAENNRLACYACHPGSVTRCLRGAMGKAVVPQLIQ
jgi:hypothetical protein